MATPRKRTPKVPGRESPFPPANVPPTLPIPPGQEHATSSPSGTNIFPEKLKHFPEKFAVAIENHYKPLFDEVAHMFPTESLYLEAKTLRCWPLLLRTSSLALYRVNHHIIPRGSQNKWQAEVEHFIAVVKRMGKKAYPDFGERIAHLRKIGMHREAAQAEDAAKNARKNPAPGVPKSDTTSKGLPMHLAMTWLTSCLWMLENHDIARVLPALKNSDGSPAHRWQEAGAFLTAKAVGRMRLRLGLVNSETICGVRCARLVGADPFVEKDPEYWQRIQAACV